MLKELFSKVVIGCVILTAGCVTKTSPKIDVYTSTSAFPNWAAKYEGKIEHLSIANLAVRAPAIMKCIKKTIDGKGSVSSQEIDWRLEGSNGRVDFSMNTVVGGKKFEVSGRVTENGKVLRSSLKTNEGPAFDQENGDVLARLVSGGFLFTGQTVYSGKSLEANENIAQALEAFFETQEWGNQLNNAKLYTASKVLGEGIQNGRASIVIEGYYEMIAPLPTGGDFKIVSAGYWLVDKESGLFTGGANNLKMRFGDVETDITERQRCVFR
jgi:hypothetical protein